MGLTLDKATEAAIGLIKWRPCVAHCACDSMAGTTCSVNNGLDKAVQQSGSKCEFFMLQSYILQSESFAMVLMFVYKLPVA